MRDKDWERAALTSPGAGAPLPGCPGTSSEARREGATRNRALCLALTRVPARASFLSVAGSHGVPPLRLGGRFAQPSGTREPGASLSFPLSLTAGLCRARDDLGCSFLPCPCPRLPSGGTCAPHPLHRSRLYPSRARWPRGLSPCARLPPRCAREPSGRGPAGVARPRNSMQLRPPPQCLLGSSRGRSLAVSSKKIPLPL